MQASVHSFDSDSGAGVVLLDDGRLVPFSAEVFAASSLLHLRLGQRLSIATDRIPPHDPDRPREVSVSRLWIVGIGDGEVIK